MEPLVTTVEQDDFTALASRAFDFTFDGTTTFVPFDKPDVGSDFGVGLIVGASCSGKTQLLRSFGSISAVPVWLPNKAIVSHFASPEIAISRLGGVGLNTIPSWLKPYHALSNGEQFRANLARQLVTGARIDEFTSVVDRTVAKATATATSKLIKREQLKNIVLASCHYDILDWLEPDWVFDTNTGQLARGSLWRRPKIKLDIYACKRELWRLFGKYHYLSNTLNKSARTYLGCWGNTPVAFTAVLAFPSGTLKNAWREHRTVVLPDFQGFGLGAKWSDAIAQIYKDSGARYFSRTAHPRLGEYRQRSTLWKPTSKNKARRGDILKRQAGGNLYNNYVADGLRVAYSHEFIGTV